MDFHLQRGHTPEISYRIYIFQTIHSCGVNEIGKDFFIDHITLEMLPFCAGLITGKILTTKFVLYYYYNELPR